MFKIKQTFHSYTFQVVILQSFYRRGPLSPSGTSPETPRRRQVGNGTHVNTKTYETKLSNHKDMYYQVNFQITYKYCLLSFSVILIICVRTVHMVLI